MIASSYGQCGCNHSRIGDWLISYERCDKHYKARRDDKWILTAAKNSRLLREEKYKEMKKGGC